MNIESVTGRWQHEYFLVVRLKEKQQINGSAIVLAIGIFLGFGGHTFRFQTGFSVLLGAEP